MNVVFHTRATHLIVNLAVELLLALSIYSSVMILGEKLVPNQSKGGICRFRRIESSKNELIISSVNEIQKGPGCNRLCRGLLQWIQIR